MVKWSLKRKIRKTTVLNLYNWNFCKQRPRLRGWWARYHSTHSWWGVWIQNVWKLWYFEAQSKWIKDLQVWFLQDCGTFLLFNLKTHSSDQKEKHMEEKGWITTTRIIHACKQSCNSRGVQDSCRYLMTHLDTLLAFSGQSRRRRLRFDWTSRGKGKDFCFVCGKDWTERSGNSK